jgi:hypothetical protein
MELGRLKQKSSWFLTGFVFGCIFIIILLLYITVKAEEKAQVLSSVTGDYSYYLE